MKDTIHTILSFKVSDENFAINALKVRHILEPGKITKVPNTSAFLPGVINLHGNIIPIADLRRMLGVENPVETNDTAIMVISPDGLLESYMGLIVDIVKEVVEVQENQIDTTQIERGAGIIDSFEGMVNIGNEFIHLINIDDLVLKVEEAK
jgi:purine-binding chemotaxis protein CheW